MYVKVLKEAGHEEAVLGMALSYYDGVMPVSEWWESPERRAKAYRRADLLAHKQGGHNKFTESVMVWIHIRATRGWWQEMDTYRVGMTKQSASTMHTLAKRDATLDDFASDVSLGMIDEFNRIRAEDPKNIVRIKANLPEGFLQDRIVCTNYRCLQNIVRQRQGHRLKYWDGFLKGLREQLLKPGWVFEIG